MVKKNLLRSISVIMACMMAVMTVACGSNTASTETAENTAVVETAQEEQLEKSLMASTAAVASTGESGKVETVYVTADANGSVNDVIVSEWLKNATASTELSDTTELKDIVNVKGSETYTDNGDGTVTWDAEGSDIYYQGTTDKALPVDMKITYTLDGKEITPAELAGKSGRVTIRFEYENKSKQTVEVDGKEVEVYTPFAMVSGMMLDSDKFTNVEVSNGKVISDGGNYVVMGVALPGLKESLNISDEKWDELENSEEIEGKLSNYFEITADTTDFELGMTITMASSDLLSDFGLADLADSDKINDLKDDMGELNDGSTQLVDGAKELKDGTGKLADGSKELKDGTSKLYDGTKELKDGTVALADGAGKLADGAGQVSDGAGKLADGAGQVSDGAGKLADGAGQVSDGAGKLADGAGQVSDGAGQLATGAGTLSEGTGKLADGSKTLANGVTAYTDGVAKVDAGVTDVINGTNTLKGYTSSLATGTAQLSVGAGQLAKGASDLNTGVQNVDQLSNALEMIKNKRTELVGMKTTYTTQEAGLEAIEGYLTTPGVPCQEAYVDTLRKLSGGKINSVEDAERVKAAGLAALASQNTESVTTEPAGAEVDEIVATSGEVNATEETSTEQQSAVETPVVEQPVVEEIEKETEKTDLGEDVEIEDEDVPMAAIIGANLTETGSQSGNVYTDEQLELLKKQAVEDYLGSDDFKVFLENYLKNDEDYQAALNEKVTALVEANVAAQVKSIVGDVSTYAATLASTKASISAINDTISFLDKTLTDFDAFVTPQEAELGVTFDYKIMLTQQSLMDLKAGVAELNTGAATLNEKLAEAATGATALDAGVAKLQSGETTLSQGTKTLVSMNDTLNGGASQVSEGAAQVNGGAAQLKTGADTLYNGTKDLKSGADTLSSGTKDLKSGADTLYNGTKDLKSGADTLSDGTKDLKSGADELNTGAGKLDEGAGKLVDGAKALDEGAGELDDGIGKVDSGVQELLDGITKLDEEGIKKLYEAFDGDLTDFADKLTAIQEAGSNYTSFAGASADENSSVKFIIKTEGVKAQDI